MHRLGFGGTLALLSALLGASPALAQQPGGPSATPAGRPFGLEIYGAFRNLLLELSITHISNAFSRRRRG